MLYGDYCINEIIVPGSAIYLGSIGFMDFLAATYRIAETDVSAATMIDSTATIDASGLLIDWNVPNSVRYLQGDFLSLALIANWTMVIEISELENFDMDVIGIIV